MTIVDQIEQVVNSGKYKIVTISEVTHWSIDSHNFHFALLKKLHTSKLITTFSSERLGILDAFLMNKWLAGEICCSLEDLYRKILPFGGLGTFKWMKYFQSTKKQFNLVGCEVDVLYDWTIKNKPWMKKTLAKFCSKEFGKKLVLKSNIKKITETQKYVKTKNDKLIYNAIINSARNLNKNTRLKIWSHNVEKIYKTYGNLYINGYHLGKLRGKFNITFPRNSRVLYLGMAAHKKECFTRLISQSDLKALRIPISKNNFYKSDKFLDWFYQSKDIYNWYSRKPTNKISIKWIDNYIIPECFLESSTKYKNKPALVNVDLVRKTQDRSKKIFIFGATVLPITNFTQVPCDYAYADLSEFQYIIIIPTSKIDRKKRFYM